MEKEREDIESEERVAVYTVWSLETLARIHRVVLVIHGRTGKI